MTNLLIIEFKMSQTIQSCQIFHNPTRTLSFDIQVATEPVFTDCFKKDLQIKADTCPWMWESERNAEISTSRQRKEALVFLNIFSK